MTRIRTLVVLSVLMLMAASAHAANAAQTLPGLTTGFISDPAFLTGGAASEDLWLGRASYEGARVVRLNVAWSVVAPEVRPAGFQPTDPSSAGYNWTSTDAAVRGFASHGLRVLMNINYAPTWAEGPNPPASASPGSWEPSAGEFGSFARAAALRYSGHFPDPLHPGSFLPRVSSWQPWNEPNLPTYISPQWVATSHGTTAESPIIYRAMLNAFYAAVKSVSSSNFVVTAGTAPFGDPPGGARVPPVEFDRDLFCLKDNANLTPLPCPDPPHLDAVSHHPYGVVGPLWHALNKDDAAVPDMYKISRVVKAAERWHHVLPAGKKQLWVTETGWDSNPPDPGGVPINTEARWVEQTMYVLWSEGVDTVLQLQIRDSPPIPSYGATNQGGSYFINGQPKPSATALRFPFVTQRKNKKHVLAWGRSPVPGRLSIERLQGKHWKTVRRISVKYRGVFETTLPQSGRAAFRARIAGQTSLTWTQSK